MADLTLEDVLSNRILDPVHGWRDRLPNEYITLTERQKESFVDEMGYRAHRRTKKALWNFINHPHLYSFSKTWWLRRIEWTGDRCIYKGG